MKKLFWSVVSSVLGSVIVSVAAIVVSEPVQMWAVSRNWISSNISNGDLLTGAQLSILILCLLVLLFVLGR